MSEVKVKMTASVEPERDVSTIKDDIMNALPNVATLAGSSEEENQFSVSDGPFGIKEISFVVIIPDDEGGTEPVESSLEENIENVRFEIESITR